MKIYLLIITMIFSICSSKSKISEDRVKKIQELLSQKNNYAPEISLTDHNDSLYVLSELRGKVVLVNFWATWCGPCRAEIPDFNELYEKYHDKGFEILGVSLTDSKKQLKDFSKVYGVKYPLLHGTNKEIDNITRAYGGVPAVPWSFLIGVNGEIIKTYPGAILKQMPNNLFENLVYLIESEVSKNQILE